MRSRLVTILGAVALVALVFLAYSCGTQRFSPTSGTTVNGAYTVLDIIPVPEHNPTGEPGGPFNSFDISSLDSVNHLFYVSDRIGLAVVVTDTLNNAAINTIGGQNAVTAGGNNASPCNAAIPPILTALGNFTRFGCRTAPFSIPGFGASGLFGGFPGAQCCAARANGVNPLSAPDGNQLTPDGRTLFVSNGSSSIVAFDLTTNPATVLADFPTGQSPDYDGLSLPNPGTANPNGIAPCIASANGRAFSDQTCGDLRADELSYGVVAGHDILLVANGDPALPFVTLVDVTDIVNRTNAAPFVVPAGMGHCLPVNPGQPYAPNPTAPNPTFPLGFPNGNFPTCIIGQIYYDNASPVSSIVPVDSANGFACPDPSNFTPNPNPAMAPIPVPSGVSGTGVGTAGANVPCHHSAIVDQNTGAFITNNGAAGPGQGGEIAVAGIGGSAFNPSHNTFFVANSNCTISTLPTQASVAVGCIDEIDPRIGNPNGPVVVNVIPVINCQPASIIQGPGTDFLVGCADHDGIAFPPSMLIINGNTGATLATFDQIGGVDEIWFNPGDNRYYLAARDFPSGPQLGVIDAGTRTWLVNVPTNSNSHSVAADSLSNRVFVPSQSGGICGTQSSNGCILVYGRQ